MSSLKTVPVTAENEDALLEVYEGLATPQAYSHPRYLAFLSAHFGDPAVVMIFTQGDTTFYYPVFMRRIGALLPNAKLSTDLARKVDCYSSWYYGGPLCGVSVPPGPAVSAFNSALDTWFRKNGVVTEFVRFDANIDNALLRGGQDVRDNRETVPVDLSPRNFEDVEALFSSSHRRALKKARRSQLRTRRCAVTDDDAWRSFRRVYASEMERKNAPTRLRFDDAFFDGLRSLGPNAVSLLVAERGGTVVGGFVTLRDAVTAFHFLSASDPRAWDDRVNNLLFTEAIRAAHKDGAQRFDLMGGRDGVFRFKSGFTPNRSRFKVLQRVHDREAYVTLSRYAATTRPARFPPYLPPER